MRSDKEFEGLLKSALTQKSEPDADIQRKVLAQWKESQNMDKKKWSAAVAVTACVLMTTVSAGATTLILNSRNAVEKSTEMTESAESQETYTDEYTTYIQSGAWKDDIADAELVFTSEKLEKNTSGAYECTYSEEIGGASCETTYYIYDRDFVDDLAVTKSKMKYDTSEDSVSVTVEAERAVQLEPSEGSISLTLVSRKAEDGTVQVKVYKK